MRILFSSYPFAPDVGGIETMSLLLSRQWSALGHDVTVVTYTADEADEEFPFPVVRRPSFQTLRRLIGAHDVYFQNNVSLRFLWPWLGTRKPLYIAHRTWLYSDSRTEAVRTALKRLFIRRATSISISRAIAPDSHVIGNAYDDAIFRHRPEIARDKELVFVGRLVEAKGVDVLLRALQILQRRGLTPRLTIIGSGPMEQACRDLSVELGLSDQVEFTGSLRGEILAARINAHRITVVPSTWHEPYGIVALEGIGCGCVVVGSSGGGLTDAIGPCGVTFQNGDSAGLARALEPLLDDCANLRSYLEAAPAHLEPRRAPNVARAYLSVLEG